MRNMSQSAALPPAPGEDLSVALALVNTRLDGPAGPLDLLAEAADARAWLAGHGFPPGAAAPDADAGADVWCGRLRSLREAIRALFEAGIDKTPPPTADLTAVNAALAAAPCVTSIAWDADGPHVGQRRTSDEPFAPVLAALAAAAGDLLAGAHAPQLARCSAHNCIRMFMRTHAARQVCSTRCGDRVRAARHYAKLRDATL
jgi:predicted RNA-binding Zn ribbon-like protein